MVEEFEIEIVETPDSTSSFGTQKNNKPKYKSKRIMIPSILGVIALIFGVHYYCHAITYVSTDDAYVEGHTVQVAPKVSGNVVKVYIDDNQQVKKRQILAEIDPIDYQVKYDQAAARLQAAIEKQKSASINVDFTSITSKAAEDQASSSVGIAQAGLEIADKQISQAKANLAQVNEDIQSAKAELDFAKINFDRYQKLYKKDSVSQQDFDKASTNFKTIKAKYNSALERRASAQSNLQSAYANKNASFKSLSLAMGKLKGASTVSQQVSMSDSARKIALAEIKQLQAAARQARLDLGYTKIYAPQTGSVTNKSVEEGDYIQAGQPIVAIVPQERWVVANFKETQLTHMKVGQLVYIKIDTYPHHIFKGRVDSVQSATGAKSSLFPPENAVGSFVKVVQRIPVKITFTEKFDPQYAIVPGMSVIPEVKVR